MTQEPTPIALADFGSFHVGGRLVEIRGREPRDIAFTRTTRHRVDPNGAYRIEAAYVQWYRPAILRCALPVVLVHGGGMTGAVWETTPDGRAGFVQILLRQGFAVYVIDAVERGRAGWCALDGIWDGEPVQRSLEEAWSLFRIGPAEGFKDRRAFPGQRFPASALETLAASFVPRWTTNGPAATAALKAAIMRIGPCTVMCHSQGAEQAFAVAAARPDLVRGVMALEPSALPEDVETLPATLIVMGDNLDATPLWEALTARIRRFVERAPGATMLELSADGLPGHTHLMMMDRRNEAVLGRLTPFIYDCAAPAQIETTGGTP
ncbi:MAG: alpha/beta fold hydrolase [Bosea sp.]|nr:alpha/beta fold hydrolase [Bosea sp. (in: a-proteobacteria)]